MAGPEAAAGVSIVIPVYQGVDLLDVAGPCEMFRWAGFDVRVVAEAKGLVTSGCGLALQAEKTTQYYPQPPVSSEIPQTDACLLDNTTPRARPPRGPPGRHRHSRREFKAMASAVPPGPPPAPQGGKTS